MMYSSEWPTWLKFIVCVAITVAALASIWGQLRDSKLIRAVARELLIKEGEENKKVEQAASEAHPPEQTIKTQVTKAADDSKSALEMLNKFQEEYNTRHMILEDRVAALEAWRKEGGTHGPA